LLLLALALLMPVPLYLVSLALFGLPHVIAELSYIAHRYRGRWPWRWWIPIGLPLACQAIVRTGVWMGAYPQDVGQIADLATLLMLTIVMALAPMRLAWPARFCAVAMAIGFFWLLEQGQWLIALLILSIAHNFTPLGLAWDLARENRQHRPMLRAFAIYFSLPVVVAMAGYSGHEVLLHTPESEAKLLAQQIPHSWLAWSEGQQGALMSALALAQCLHYLAVMRWLPATACTSSVAMMGTKLVWLTVFAASALMMYFWVDYGQARQMYGIAAGFHAWLEWPILWMVLIGQPSAQPQT
jgi:hypothetical protein